MPDEPTPDTSKDSKDSKDSKESTKAGIQPGMTEQQIRDSGLAIDVPFETTGEPERLKYADLGKTWTPPEGWPPEQGTATTDEEDNGGD